MALLVLGPLLACSSLAITSPTKGGMNLANPQKVEVTTSGSVGPIALDLDGRDPIHVNNQAWLVLSQLFFYLEPGIHNLTASAQDSGGNALSDTCQFGIAAGGCPLCYPVPASAPPGSYVHPFLGEVCTGSSCDFRVFDNFGPAYYNAPICAGGFQARDCIGQNAEALCGSNTSNCAGNAGPGPSQAFAVQFTPALSGTLAHIRVPIGWRSGTNQFEVWVAEDNAGQPGNVLEHITLTNIRAWTLVTVAPAHIYSASHPALNANTSYWLVIGPGAVDTVGSWNDSLGDVPSATSPNYKMSQVANGVAGIGGPWLPTGAPLRPAFQVDLH